ncbi:hypothetical protein GQ53DRAFT_890380 [Thozetella sp. PMI_491]|nr:hypothetical protein GQ53DRAFT_890380 [Thozetella sp. PMI_491]
MAILMRWLATGLVASSGYLVAGAPAASADASATASIGSDMASTIIPADQPLATLTPAPPPGVDMGGIGVLIPVHDNEHFYNGSQPDAGNDTNAGIVTIQLSVTYNHPSVALDHSIYLTDVACENGMLLRAVFNSTGAYAYAESTWPALVANGSSLVLITSAATCGAHEDQNAFFLASSLVFDDPSLSFVAHGEEKALNDLMQGMQVGVGGTVQIPAASNDTSGQQADNSTSDQPACGLPADDTLEGLPAVACGTGFDAALNSRLGYYNVNDSRIQGIFSVAGSGGGTGLLKRSFWDDLDDFIDDIADAIESAAEAILDAAVSAARFISETVESIVSAVVSIVVAAYKLVEFIITGEYDDSWTFGLRLMPSSSSMMDSPWGEAYRLVDYNPGEKDSGFSESKAALEGMRDDLIGEPDPEPGIEVFCVDCGISGSVTVAVHLSIHPFDGIGEGSVGVHGNMYAGLYLGIDAFAKADKTVTKQLISRGLPGWSIPGIISIGPELSLSVQAGVEVQAEGQIFAGASLNWTDFQAKFDIAHPSKSTSSGWDPIFDRKFNVHGSVSATAHLGLPIKLFFGVDVFDGAFTLGAGLVDTPAIVATAKFEAATDVTTGEVTIGSDSCVGVEVDVSLTNDLAFELDPGGSWPLANWPGPTLASACLGHERTGEEEEDAPAKSNTTSVPDLEGTVTCPDHNGRIFKDAAGNRFSILCFNSTSKSLWHVDFKAFDTFNQCIEWCAGHKRCAGVSWYDISYLSSFGPGFFNIDPIWGTDANGKIYTCAMDDNRPPTALVNDGRWSATPVAYEEEITTNVTCPSYDNAVYVGPDGHSWRIHCSGSIPWYDDGPYLSPCRQLQECMDFCAGNPDCSGARWYPTTGLCQIGTKNPAMQAPDANADPVHSVELLNPHGIVSVMYGKLDVTDYAIKNWATGTRLMIDTAELNRWAPVEKQKYEEDGDVYYLGFPNRPIFMLYTYGGSMKSWVGGDWMGKVTIYPPGVPNTTWVPGVAYVPGTPSTNLTFTVDPAPLARPDDITWVRIVEVCYALAQQRLPIQWSLLYETARGTPFTVGWGYAKTAFWNNWPNPANNERWMVVWYKDTRVSENGRLYAAVARDGENINLMYRDGALNKREDTIASVHQRTIAASSREVLSRTTNATASNSSISGRSRRSVGPKALNFGTATVLDTTGSLALYPGVNGNLLVAAASGNAAQNLSILTGNTTLTAVTIYGNGTAAGARPSLFIGGDSAGRVLHYFPDELAALGASRLRLAFRDSLPLGSRLAGLVPSHTPQHEGMVLAFDASAGGTPPPATVGRKPLYLVICDIADQINRVFLVQDSSTAAITAALEADDLVSVEQAGPDAPSPGWL